jgi:hypothetical protein
MSGWLDDTLVGLALCAGFGYAIYSLGPKSWRARWSSGAQAVLHRLPGPAARRVAAQLAARAGKSGGSCGGCDNCGSTTLEAGRAGPSEVRVPLAKIGKRR